MKKICIFAKKKARKGDALKGPTGATPTRAEDPTTQEGPRATWTSRPEAKTTDPTKAPTGRGQQAPTDTATTDQPTTANTSRPRQDQPTEQGDKGEQTATETSRQNNPNKHRPRTRPRKV